jgi:hypothetical protein
VGRIATKQVQNQKVVGNRLALHAVSKDAGYFVFRKTISIHLEARGRDDVVDCGQRPTAGEAGSLWPFGEIAEHKSPIVEPDDAELPQAT